MKRFFFAWVMLLGLCGFLVLSETEAFASEVDILLNKLVEKKILTQQEADELLKSIAQEKKRERDATEDIAKQTVKDELKGKIPKVEKWVENFKFKGDLRLRYQNEDRKDVLAQGGLPAQAESDRDRLRFRWRLGMEAKINPEWTAAFGLSSNGGSGRSTNQTLENTFETPDAMIEHAFIRYKPLDWFSFYGGKFKNPLWEPKDLMWDTDINPEGISFTISPKVSEALKVWFTPSWFVIEELNPSSSDIYLFPIQAGVEYKFDKLAWVKFAPTYYAFSSLKNNTVPHRSSSNSPVGISPVNTNFRYDYDALSLVGEVGFNIGGFIEHIALFGEYVKTGDPDDNNKGWLAGIRFGNKKINKLGDWTFIYNYRKLERDGWLDFLTDSDFYGGATNVKGHEFELTLGISKNVSFGIDWYIAKPIQAIAAPAAMRMDPRREETLIQLDLMLKW